MPRKYGPKGLVDLLPLPPEGLGEFEAVTFDDISSTSDRSSGDITSAWDNLGRLSMYSLGVDQAPKVGRGTDKRGPFMFFKNPTDPGFELAAIQSSDHLAQSRQTGYIARSLLYPYMQNAGGIHIIGFRLVGMNIAINDLNRGIMAARAQAEPIQHGRN